MLLLPFNGDLKERSDDGKFYGIVTLIEVGRNGLQQCPFRLPRSHNPTH